MKSTSAKEYNSTSTGGEKMKRIVRVNQRSCLVAVPTAVRQALKIEQGDFIEYKINRNGTVTIRKSVSDKEESK